MGNCLPRLFSRGSSGLLRVLLQVKRLSKLVRHPFRILLNWWKTVFWPVFFIDKVYLFNRWLMDSENSALLLLFGFLERVEYIAYSLMEVIVHVHGYFSCYISFIKFFSSPIQDVVDCWTDCTCSFGYSQCSGVSFLHKERLIILKE